MGDTKASRQQGELEGLRYPAGRFQPRTGLDDADRAALIAEIRVLPEALRAAVAGLAPDQLDTPYRPAGWTVRQVVHHVPDSHANAYVRFKLALTEDEPTIKPYDEAAWAELPDGRSEDVEGSLLLLQAIHRRWVRVLEAITPAQYERVFHHPELGPVTLERNLQLYAWHGRHHLAHITELKQRMGW